MSRVARIAVGTVQPDAEGAPLIWALLDSLSRMGLRVQCVHSRARFSPREGATAITGMPSRHLDSWLMSPSICRSLLLRGCEDRDLAVIEGRFDSAIPQTDAAGGRLSTLCDWLDLPRLVILDASRLSTCHLPPRPDQAAGILLDRVVDTAHQSRLQTLLETLWGLPVLGALEDLPVIRGLISNMPSGGHPSPGLCRTLGNCFSRTAQFDRLLQIARSRELSLGSLTEPLHRARANKVHVAVAYDDAFNCYFPDTLDLLEAAGATVREFSPLQDERLPPETEIVYFGCGHPEEFARELEQNRCMTSALHNHLCQGLRIYAEGGGMAYLCQHVETPDGRRFPMVGALPAIARQNAQPCAPRATEIVLGRSNWLGPVGSRWRGYLGNCWSLEPTGPLHCYPEQAEHRLDLVGRHQAIGSRLHFNFVAQSSLMDRFFEPHAASIDVDTPPLVRTS